MLGDLHCHSVYSDGFNTTSEIADYACRAGLTHIALSDHDTMAGVEELEKEANRVGIRVIPAVECTCIDARRNQPVHMLCYAPCNASRLQAFLDTTLVRRREAKLAMAEKISRLYPLTMEDVLHASRKSQSIYEVHLIGPLASMGYTPTVCGELLTRLIGPKGSCYVPIQYPDVYGVVETIRDAGGLSVLAHPGQFASLPLIEELAKAGLLDGVECYHPRSSEDVTRRCLALCEHYGLIITGGSDFHGMYSRNPNPLGTCVTNEIELKQLLNAIREKGAD